MSKVGNGWRTLEPMQKGWLVGMLVGAVLALLMWHLSWIAAGFGVGAGIGYLIGRRQGREHPEEGGRKPGSRPGRQDDGTEDQDRVPVAHSPSSAGHRALPVSPGTAVERHREVVARARAEDVLNGVFTLSLYNLRHTGPVRPGQEPVDVRAALGDLHDAAAIDEAILRTEELLAHAADLGFGACNSREDRAELHLSHPGFSLEHLGEALSWGHRHGR